MNIDDALTAYRGDLVAAAHRWRVRRERRRRRFVLTSGVVVLGAVIVGTAIAATGWLVGSPAPPSVKSDFGSYAPQLGFNPQPGKAVLVASSGAYQLYATTNKQGGYCVLVSAPWKRPGPHGEGGDCSSRQQASVAFWAGIGGMAGAPHGGTRVVIDGRTRHRNAANVRFTAPEGKTITASVGRSGFFIVGYTIRRPVNSTVISGFVPGICRWTSTFTALDATAREIGQKTLTFGPRICMRPPQPVVRTKAGTKTFTLGRGQVGYLTQAHPGDNVACRGASHLLTITIPEAAQGRYRRTHDRHLQLNVRHTRNGRIWVMCQ